MNYYLGIDQGTTGVSALLFDEGWRQIARGYRKLRQIYPCSGWVEHDAEDIWQAVCDSVTEAMAAGGVSPAEIVCIGLDHEGESVMLWDKESGKPLGHTVVWQDRRTEAEAAALRESHGALFREKTGLYPDAYFSALKLKWLLDNTPDARALATEGRLLAGTMDSWILWNITGGAVHATDASTASRTMLMNLKTQEWDDELLSLLDIPASILPVIRDSAFVYGQSDKTAFCGISAPVSGILTDQQASLFGHGCLTSGDLKTTYGTGCFLLMNTGDTPVRSEGGLITTVAWRIGGKTTYALDGGIYIAGAALGWLSSGLGILDNAPDSEVMANRVSDNGGVYFVPAFSGLTAPYGNPAARGTMVGLTAAVTKEHIVRATLESIAYQVCDLVRLTERESVPIRTMRCDGGLTGNGFLMQFQADILGIPLDIPEISETTALGAAMMAALGIGVAATPEQLGVPRTIRRTFEPSMSESDREALLSGWHRAVRCAIAWTNE